MLRHWYRLARHAGRDSGIVVARDRRWPDVEAEFLARHPACLACGTRTRVTAHHIVPFWVDADRELDPANLVPLCMAGDRHDHLLLGHGGDYRSWQPDVRALAGRALVARSPEGRQAIVGLARATRRYR